MKSSTCDPCFSRLLLEYEPETLFASDATIYGMWPDLSIAFVNLAWYRFAELNGGAPQIEATWKLGSCVIDAISAPLRPFFESNYAKCLQERRPWEHVYECSSAELYRKFHMMTFPLGDSEGLLVINSLRQETAHERTVSPPIDDLYRNAHGHIVQCSHCRRVRRLGTEHTWDWAPEWVETQPSNTSHSLCEPCVGFYYSSPLSPPNGFAEPFRTSFATAQ